MRLLIEIMDTHTLDQISEEKLLRITEFFTNDLMLIGAFWWPDTWDHDRLTFHHSQGIEPSPLKLGSL